MKAKEGGVRKGLIDSRQLTGLDILKSGKHWADWSTKLKDAVGALGHAVARVCLDQVEGASEMEAAVKNIA